MELIELSEEEFKEFANNSPQANFHQTADWGHLKEENGWKIHLLGLKDEDTIVAGCLLLSKIIPTGKTMFYSPRGFLIDYNNIELLKIFTEKLKQFGKSKNGVFIKIDPYVSYQERDIDGNIVEGGTENKQSFANLKELGYKHFGFNLMQDTLQPRWIFVTPTKGKTVDEIMKNMDPKTRQIIRKNEKSCIRTREIAYDELKTFKDIMQHTGDRRDFIDRPLSYYQGMYNNLSKNKIIKILLAELHTKDFLENLKEEQQLLNNEYNERQQKFEEHPEKMNEKKYLSKQKENKNNLERLESKIIEITDLQKKHGDIITLGGILFLIHGNEVLSLVGGSYKQFMEFQSPYTLHWEMMKYAIENNYERYNFYGITGDFREENPLYGLYIFKRGYGGKVVELMGEFDLIINKKNYLAYKTAYKLYKFQKRLMNKLSKNS